MIYNPSLSLYTGVISGSEVTEELPIPDLNLELKIDESDIAHLNGSLAVKIKQDSSNWRILPPETKGGYLVFIPELKSGTIALVDIKSRAARAEFR